MDDDVELYELIKGKPKVILAEIGRYSRLLGKAEAATERSLDDFARSLLRDTETSVHHQYKETVSTRLAAQIELRSVISHLEQMLEEAKANG